MKYYVAPLEGITGYLFRNAFNEYFGEGVDCYYTPFIVPHVKRAFSTKEQNELIPEHNDTLNLIPQILTNDADDFNRLSKEIRQLGYSQINLNLGCPSKTVTAKGRGAAMLEDRKKLDEFLDRIFTEAEGDISIKTRIGVVEADEFADIISVYTKYPIKELIIHPRVMTQMYGGLVNMEAFNLAVKSFAGPICYNGDVNSCEACSKLTAAFRDVDNVSAIMIGRGILRKPSLIREIKGGKPFNREEIAGFLDRLKMDYLEEFSGETPVLFKLKEIWGYLGSSFSDERLIRKIMKSKSIREYDSYVNQIIDQYK